MGVTNFIPQVWSARLLEHLDKEHVYGMLCNRDYEGDITAFGDTVKVNQIGNVTVKDYANGAIDDPEELDGSQAILSIDQAKYFNFKIDDVDNAQSNPKLMDGAMERASYGLNDVSDAYIAGLMVAGAGAQVGSDASPISATVDNAYKTLVDLEVALTKNSVPRQGRWVVVPAFYEGLLLQDDRFVGAGSESNRATLEAGYLGRGAGFDVYISNNAPVDSGKHKIVAGTNQGCSFAEQLIEVEAYRPEKSFADAVKGLHVYGAKVLQPKALAVATVSE